MNLGENLTRSISGSVDKAILCIKKPIPGKDKVLVLDKNDKIIGMKMDFDMSGDSPRVKTASQLQNLLAGEVQNKKSRNTWIDKKAKADAEDPNAHLSFGKSIENTIRQSGYHILKVKYNPSKISINSRAGSFMEQGPGGEAAGNWTQHNMPPQTYMSFEIILDEMNPQDAFMFDKINNITVGSVVSDIASGIKNGNDLEGYTVRPMVEALMGILTQAETRKVVFFWSEMSFAGEVVSIDARYTMFNPLGNPVRAVVRFTLCQDEYDDFGYWSDAVDGLDNLPKNWQGQVGNLLNFK